MRLTSATISISGRKRARVIKSVFKLKYQGKKRIMLAKKRHTFIASLLSYYPSALRQRRENPVAQDVPREQYVKDGRSENRGQPRVVRVDHIRARGPPPAPSVYQRAGSCSSDAR